MVKYVSVSIPEGIIKEVDKIVESPNSVYSSRADFIKDILRKAIEETKKKN